MLIRSVINTVKVKSVNDTVSIASVKTSPKVITSREVLNLTITGAPLNHTHTTVYPTEEQKAAAIAMLYI